MAAAAGAFPQGYPRFSNPRQYRVGPLVALTFSMRDAVGEVAASAAEAERRAGPWIQRFARFGYAAKGVVYCVVALIAVRAAFSHARATDTRGAFAAVLDQPLGPIVLPIIALGLFAFALWTLYQGVRNPEDDAWYNRLGNIGTALVHIGLALTAARFALNGRADIGVDDVANDGNGDVSHWTAAVLQQPLGKWIIIGIGLGLMAHALWQFYRAATAKLDSQLDLSRTSPARRPWLIRTARFGMAARGVVFLVAGAFAVRAGWQYDPGEVRDLGGALRVIEQQPLGTALLALVAFGLFAFGIYEFIRARYRIIQPRTAFPETRIRLTRRT